jgi:hypothetical protein
MEGRRRNRLPWTRLVAEGVVIVVSILLAFFVDTSWDRYQERGEERSYLVSLQREFEAASSLLEASLRSRTIVSDRVLNLILQAQGAEPAPEDSLFL